MSKKTLWTVFAIALALSVLAEFAIDIHLHFGIDGWFGFHAVYGFLACVALVLVARLMGFVLKRADDYYERIAAAREEQDDA
ncbi:MAG: hypothetical protein IT479_13955 [Xanthomonadales bacterium]|nr:hypothetical protein [Xanthomonadales bacterium]MCC6594364.1 hypothetical protein [Xanthomonadales bacterium]MCE7931219.1 hypothetical protein [Xanthomonadales bacterium PRO6]